MKLKNINIKFFGLLNARWSSILQLKVCHFALFQYTVQGLSVHSYIFVPAFPLGGVAGLQPSENLEYLTVNSNLR